MIQNKMHQFIKGCSKFKPKNKILYISIIYASILFTGCQTVQTIVSHPDYDMFDLLRASNPQPIGFRGNLLVKRQKIFYCTYSLGITETS